MKNVYVVMLNEIHKGGLPIGVFDTKNRAESFIEKGEYFKGWEDEDKNYTKLREREINYYEINEFELNDEEGII